MDKKVEELVNRVAESCYKICAGCANIGCPWRELTDVEKEPFRKAARLHLSYPDLALFVSHGGPKLAEKIIFLSEALKERQDV